MAKKHSKKIKGKLFNRQRSGTSTLESNCSTGYETPGKCAYHHVMPVSSLQDGNIETTGDKLSYLHNCMSLTSWDINDGLNLIGLPTKRAYLGITPIVPPLPCHQNDHPAYTDAVIKYLNGEVWDPLAKVQKPCTADGKSILDQLKKGSNKWRRFLVNRGTDAPDCWVNREKPSYKDKWYKPFSMHPSKPRPAVPPKGYLKLSWMSDLFKAIG